MNRPLRSLWLEMLRSGAFQQTRGKLQRSVDEVVHHTAPTPDSPQAGHCCLGVLCEAADKAGLVHLDRWADGTLKGVTLRSQGLLDLEDSLATAPTHPAYPAAPGSGVANADALAHLNDVQRASFTEIANWIEKHIPADDATDFAI